MALIRRCGLYHSICPFGVASQLHTDRPLLQYGSLPPSQSQRMRRTKIVPSSGAGALQKKPTLNFSEFSSTTLLEPDATPSMQSFNPGTRSHQQADASSNQMRPSLVWGCMAKKGMKTPPTMIIHRNTKYDVAPPMHAYPTTEFGEASGLLSISSLCRPDQPHL